MRKIIAGTIVLSILALLAWALPASAKNERPKGLDDRGPLTKITFIHYKKGHAKPPKPPRPDKDKGGPSCYGFLGKGVYWKENLPRDLYVNPENSGMAANSVLTIFDESATTWDIETNSDLYGVIIKDNTANWDDTTPDFRSELSFRQYPNSEVIAVTVVWGYFGGPPQLREIVDFDILFNTDFTWGNADKNGEVMDLENIATHEMGHGWGLDDMYQDTCSSVTMYGYSDHGETTKRDLELPDIEGIQKLYGAF